MNPNPSAKPQILNLTHLPVTVARADGRGAITFPPDGTVARIRYEENGGSAEWGGVVIIAAPRKSVLGLPPQIPGRLLIVSRAVFDFCSAKRSDLVAPQTIWPESGVCEFLIGGTL